MLVSRAWFRVHELPMSIARAEQAMRRILVDHARRRRRAKRLGNLQQIPLDEHVVSITDRRLDFADLDEALGQLAVNHPRKARVVEMKFLVGLTTDQIAERLGVTARTVERDWQYARAWLYREMSDAE